ncbi:hypothetical protein DAI22_03g294950 [Oryza sativa Japonica Group]|uniref:Uncharacterized protein n=1 Tax=Oryza sativa subsp. japonica TaxID=39947 RepID=Q6AVV1_ORYSJ|nr:hypothetical protein [Oryza sativa Japonica Group]KAF2940719.1 hypothetical protein DAI22_03g294950 [Oryza sativa Japonica Group]
MVRGSQVTVGDRRRPVEARPETVWRHTYDSLRARWRRGERTDGVAAAREEGSRVTTTAEGRDAAPRARGSSLFWRGQWEARWRRGQSAAEGGGGACGGGRWRRRRGRSGALGDGFFFFLRRKGFRSANR